MNVANYYAWLAWFQDTARRFGHDTGQHSLTVHRLLALRPNGRVVVVDDMPVQDLADDDAEFATFRAL